MKKGDYVLATKYSDGDPADGWAVGFFDGFLQKVTKPRFMVIDNDGKQFRNNGFRRCQHMPIECADEFIRIAKSYDYPNWPAPGSLSLWGVLRDLKRKHGLLPSRSHRPVKDQP